MARSHLHVSIQPAGKPGHYNIVMTGEMPSEARECVDSAIETYLQKTTHMSRKERADAGNNTSFATNYSEGRAVVYDVPPALVQGLCCGVPARSIDLGVLHDNTLRFRLHEYGRKQGVSVTPR